MRTALACLIALLVVSPALAVKPSHWKHTTEADFKQGTFTRVVATNLGDLKLSREVRSLLGQDPRISAVFAMAQAPDGTIFAATGPEGILLSIKDDKVTTAAELGQNVNLFSLLVDSKGRVLVGTGGEKGQILRLEQPGQKPVAVFSHDGVQYIWSMLETPDGSIYVATGPNGQLFHIAPDGSSRLVLETEENNLLCLASDGKDLLYAGTDPNGLLLRINRHTGELFVLYDAAESEISALARSANGTLFAATAQAGAVSGAADAGVSEQTGRPEAEQRGLPIPSEPPTNPEPPELPAPPPGEPIPIPKEARPLNMLILADEFDEAQAEAPTTEQSGAPAGPAASRGPRAGAARPAPANGNAIYRVDAEGFVTEIFRQQLSVYAMVEQDGALLIATGAEQGAIYQIDPAADETATVATVDSQDILCLLAAKDGRIFMGQANAGEISAMTPGFAGNGVYTSPVLDATQISRFGSARLRGTLPQGTTLTISTRSGNVEEATAPGWSAWSPEISAAEFVQIPSAPARFLQYRLKFTTSNAQVTPAVEEVDVAYQMPNLAPQIESVRIEPEQLEDDQPPSGKLTVTWHAVDANEDTLQSSLYMRRGSRSPWILLKDKLKDQMYEWDTRTVGDGRYEIRVEVSDAADNAQEQGKTTSRISDPVTLDNTAPVIGDVKTSVAGGNVTVGARVIDRTSTVAALQYSINSSDVWQTVLPSDKIADSPEEAYEFVAPDLQAGTHQITLRATDSKGNRAFESITVTVEGNTR